MTTHAEPAVVPRKDDSDYPLATCKHCKKTVVVLDAAFKVGEPSSLRWFHFDPRTWYCRSPEEPAALAVADQKDNSAGHEHE